MVFILWAQSLFYWQFAFFLHLQGTSGLGFAIVEESRDGRQGIYVRSVTPGGVAAQV